MSGSIVADEDRCVACVECVSDSLSQVLIKLIDGSDVLGTWSEVEEDLAFIVRRGFVTTFDSWQERATQQDMNTDEGDNQEQRNNCVRATAESIDKPQPASGKDDDVNRKEQEKFDGIVDPPESYVTF